MIHFPLPILTALFSVALGMLVWRAELGHRLAKILFVSLFAVIALGAFLVALRFGYGVEQFVPIQRAIPLFIGPLLYLGFIVQARQPQTAKPLLAIHLTIAIFGALLPYLSTAFRAGFDLVISASALFYSVELLLLWKKGPDHLSFARIELANRLSRLNLLGAIILMSMLLLDAAIALSFANSRAENALELISFGAILSIGGLVSILVLMSHQSNKSERKASSQSSEDGEGDSENQILIKRLDELMMSSTIYLDTELTVERLAKRLHVPVRSLSEAINQNEGMNVSQFVNKYRLAHAVELLTTTDLSVTKIAEQSGFLARSNFYREFMRVYNQSPASYRVK